MNAQVIAVRGIRMHPSEYNDRDMELVLRGIGTRCLQILLAEGVVVEHVYARNCSQTTREQGNNISTISIKQNRVFRVFKVF